MNTVWVQPLFESMVIFAWCVLGGVLTDKPQESPAPATIAAEKGAKIMAKLESAVFCNKPEEYVETFAEENRADIREKISRVLTTPAKYDLVMETKSEVVAAGSYEAQIRVKILVLNRCNSKYEENIETALVTIAPRAESDVGRFFSQPRTNPAEQDWEITKWETESVVPYDRSKDR